MRRVLSVITLLAIAGGARAQTDAPSGVVLAWQAPANCPGEARVQASAERLLGQSLATLTGVDVAVAARVVEDGTAFRLELAMTTARGTRRRTLAHARCELLGEAAAVIVAIAIDPAAVANLGASQEEVLNLVTGREEQPAPPPSARGAAAARAETRPPPADAALARRQPAPEVGPAIQGSIRVEGGIGFGALAGVEPGMALALALVHPIGRVELAGRHWFERSVRLSERPDSGVDVSLWTGGVRLCPVPRAGDFEFPLCAGVDVGAMLGRGVELEDATSERDVWAAVAVSVSGAYVTPPGLAPWITAEGYLALVRPAFSIEGHGEIHRARAGGVRGLVGLEWRFP